MDHAAITALATALEIELEPLRRQLEALSRETDFKKLEEHANELLDHLPYVLAASVGLHYSAPILKSILATRFAEGVGAIRGTKAAEVLLRSEVAFDSVLHSALLKDAANPLGDSIHAINIRAEALAKLLKGQIVQDVRNKLLKADLTALPKAKELVAGVATALQDLTKDAHIKAHVEVQGQLAKGYGLFSVHQKDALLRSVPFQEFYRAEHRVEWRDWPVRWNEQGGTFYAGVSDYPEGRMIAEVNSNIWQDLANYADGTGQPYPPFAFNSGMSVKPVSVADAKKLGLYGRHNKPQKAKKLDFNAGIQFSADFDDDLKSVLLDSLADWAEKQGEIVHV